MNRLRPGSTCNLYYSPLYPLIHLPFDRMEEGCNHNDFIPFSSKGSRILWLPLVDYMYDPLSFDNTVGLCKHLFMPHKYHSSSL